MISTNHCQIKNLSLSLSHDFHLQIAHRRQLPQRFQTPHRSRPVTPPRPKPIPKLPEYLVHVVPRPQHHSVAEIPAAQKPLPAHHTRHAVIHRPSPADLDPRHPHRRPFVQLTPPQLPLPQTHVRQNRRRVNNYEPVTLFHRRGRGRPHSNACVCANRAHQAACPARAAERNGLSAVSGTA